MAIRFWKKRSKDQDALDNALVQASILIDGKMAVGIAHHPFTKRWQSWVWMHGTDIICLSAHNDLSDASKVARQVADAWKERKLDELIAFLQSLPIDNLAEPLPPQVMIRIIKLIKNE